MRITYYVQRYRPTFEAISKEVQMLAQHNSKQYHVEIHDLHLDKFHTFRWNHIKSYHFAFYPLTAGLIRLRSSGILGSSPINHIYTSLGDLPYLHVLDLKNTILTAAASCNFTKVKRRAAKLRKLKKIVVESETQHRQLKSLGIKSEVIYPPVDLNKFSYVKPQGKFNILYASCPVRKSDFRKRGIYLILETAKICDVNFNLAWRGGPFAEMQKMAPKNVIVKNEVVQDMNLRYATAHATIIPYTKYDDFLKLVPNSAIESLAAGKPLLVSSETDIARLVKKEKCGIVFPPTREGLTNAIKELRNSYSKYQKNCLKTAKLFSQDKFLRKYNQIYGDL